MKVIIEVICSKCSQKQVNDIEDLLRNDLFWRVCEFCNQYGLKIVTRHKLTLREWMEVFYNTLGFRVVQAEALIKDLGKDPYNL
jgi:hypothetical protein